MCSVVGYIGKNHSRSFVCEGLQRLEYRGYDSAGFACIHPHEGHLLYARAEGRLENLTNQIKNSPIDGHLGIGHTRWATHGAVCEANAHPQFDCNKRISVVHNGILENFYTLRKQLEESGHVFTSTTDSEVIAHLLESTLLFHKTLKGALIDLVHQLEGAYTFLGISQEHKDVMILVRQCSPVCIGIGDGEMFVASDPLAFAGKTSKVVFLPDKTFAFVRNDCIELYDFDGKALPIHTEDIDITWTGLDQVGYEHFMLKEIYEQKKGIAATLDFLKAIEPNLWDHLGISAEQAKDLEEVHLIGCGTSWHASLIAKFFFEKIVGIPAYVHVASEFRYASVFTNKKSIYIAVSQSGETADTLEALRLVKAKGFPTIALSNVASSTMIREADGFLLTQAGYEVAVVSTKAFSTQVATLYWFAHCLAIVRGRMEPSDLLQAEADLLVVAEVLENCIENYKREIVDHHAPRYAMMKHSIFLGRNIGYPFAMEAALKLMEISYIFVQSYPAGELKHGLLALVEKDLPVFIFSSQDPIIYQKLLGNVQEVKARGAHVVAFAFEGQDELCAFADVYFTFPRVKPLLDPLAMTGLMQFFVYHIAKVLGKPIDKPRNLAKSVTVE